MKYFAVFAVFFVAQIALVHNRQIEEILEDFEPIFKELHEDIGQAQTISHGEGKLQEQSFNDKLYEQKFGVLQNYENVLNQIEQKKQEVLTNNRKSDEVIKMCNLQQTKEIDLLAMTSDIRINVCTKIGRKVIDMLNKKLFEFYDIQYNMHFQVEEIKKNCNTSKTPLEMQTCLIQNLYLTYKPKVKDMEKEMYEMLRNNTHYLNKSIENLKICYQIVVEEITTKAGIIETNFKNCIEN